ncbi:ABC transporter ATP-binding protein [uncultured Aquimarina sp.]|uniref:ABC transporter ATP-binding protein n=1 Tax=uncultured Aquimarina sp. TaxID=575652 RepID=UPI0026218D18|nr:ABC transporter ATP-binding protein [uncultured Aquimarina sp.]
MSAIEVEHISRSYGEVLALDDINFNVEEGELFGLIGPDGAGKSTLFRILTTLLIADKGKARVVGHDVVENYKDIRKKVGYMPGRFSLYQDLSVEENLSFFATIFGTTIKENYDLVKDIYIQIEPFKKRLAGKLSGGMKQKLALCCALIHKPEVLFLDEPTTGVDAVSRKEFWDMLQSLKKKNIAILVSTPYMDEASLCDRIGLIQKGKILKIDKPQQMMNDFKKPLYAIKTNETYNTLQYLRQQDFTESVLPFGEYLHLITRERLNTETIKIHLKQKGFTVSEVKEIKPTVEDIFLDLSDNEESLIK